jgi:hypothetical protein
MPEKGRDDLEEMGYSVVKIDVKEVVFEGVRLASYG